MRARSRARLRVLAGGVVLAVATLVGAGPVPAGPGSVGAVGQGSPPSRLLLNHEHVDALSVGYEDGRLSMELAADLPSGSGQLFDPSGVLLQLKDAPAARAAVPDLPEYAFLGDPGEPLWLAPMTQGPDVVWPGWNTERLSPGVLVDDAVHLHLRDVEGPGNVEVFMSDPIGLPIRILSSTDPALRSHVTSVGTHAHANWTFDALGAYTLTFEATATTVDGSEVSTGPVDYQWLVGPLGTATGLSVAPESAREGDEVTLTAPVGADAVPEGGLPGTVTFLDGDTALGDAPVVDGVATLSTASLAVGTHQLRARFVPDPATPHVADAVTGSDSAVVPYAVTAADPDPDPDPDPGPDPDPDPGQCAIEAVVDVGHVDVAARIVDGELVSQVKDTTGGGPPVWRDLGTVAFHVTPAALTQVPAGGGFDFIGPAGSDVWLLPQVQDPDLLWPGWNTEGVDYSRLDGGVTWWLDAVEGPGDLAVYQVGNFGAPGVVFDGSGPLPQSLALESPTHAHGNWAFDTEGIYELAFRHTARLDSGEELSDSGTLAVAVGDVDLDELCPGGGVPSPPDPGDPGDPVPPGDPGDPGAPPSLTTSGPDGRAPATTRPVARRCATPPATSPAAGDDDDGGSSGDAVVLDAGHVDYAARLVDGDLRSQVKDGTAAGSPVWRDPEQVVFHVKPEASTQVPPGAQFGFLGPAGSTIWQIPQTQGPALLWLGWNTEEIAPGAVSGPITWALDAVDGPGELAVYTLGSFGQPTVLLASGDGAGGAYEVPVGTHAHGNWAFSAEGVYRVRFTHRAQLPSGQAVSDTRTVTFAVGATDPADAIPAASRVTPATTRPPAAGETATPECRLPRTGSDLGGILMTGGLLVGAGSGLTLAARRRGRRAGAA